MGHVIRWVDKQIGFRSWNRILLRKKTVDTHNNLDGYQNDAEWKKLVPKGYILYNSMDIISLKENYNDGKQIGAC